MLTAAPSHAARRFARDLDEAQAWWADVRSRFRLGLIETERPAQDQVIGAFADALFRYDLGLTERGARDLALWLLTAKDPT
jgi:hypothetical protein